MPTTSSQTSHMAFSVRHSVSSGVQRAFAPHFSALFSLARATRGPANARALWASTRPVAATTTPWTLGRSVHISSDQSVQAIVHQPQESSQERNEASPIAPSGDSVHPDQAGPHEDGSVRRHPLLARETQIPSATVDQASKRVADLTSDELDDIAPSVLPLLPSNTSKSKHPTNARAQDGPVAARSKKKFNFVRRMYQPKSPPSVVLLSGLSDNTTISDVLLSIREACVVGKLTYDEARVLEARMHKRREKYTSRSASVDFRTPSGAKRIYTLSRAGDFMVRGRVPRAGLQRRKNALKPLTLDGEEAGTSPENFSSADPEEKRRYIEEMKLKDNLVRRTSFNYNRKSASAVQDEAQLQLNVEFRSISDDGHRVSAEGFGQKGGLETDETTKF